MKNILLLVMAAGTLTVTAQTKKVVPTTKPASTAVKSSVATKSTMKLKSAQDSLSYALGILDGTFFKSQGLKNINADVLGKACLDAVSGKPSIFTPEQANEIVRKEIQKMSRILIKPNLDAGAKFLEENKKKANVKVTASGLQYEVITQGTGAKPADTSKVKVHYEGFLLNGKKFDSSRDRGEPISFGLNQVIRGWTEGVQLMPVGSRYKLYIPYNLAYGEQGAGEAIPGGSTLIFDVELLGIEN
jgi:FKBP-type peptidyl-prolyl cis-trans isomerase FklB